jgi:hypothetical protein
MQQRKSKRRSRRKRLISGEKRGEGERGTAGFIWYEGTLSSSDGYIPNCKYH